jgi:hypothetical protein
MLLWIDDVVAKSKFLQFILTAFWSFMTIVQIIIAFIMICATNLIINGYNEKCGLKSAIPFICDSTEQVTQKPTSIPSKIVVTPTPSATPTSSAKPVVIPSKPKTVQAKARMNVNCDNNGICYYSPTLSPGRGLAYDDWNGNK